MKHLAIWMVFAALLAMMAPSVAAQTTPSIRAPQLGLVFEEQARQLRLIEGVAGASSLGTVIDSGSPVEQAWLAPNAKIAVVRLGGDAPRLAVVDWRGVAKVLQSDQLPATVDALAVSPSASAFALIAEGKLQVWLIANSQLTLSWTRELPDATALAVNDSGSLVAYLGAGQVSVVDAGGRNWALLAMDQLGAMGFSSGTQFAVADSSSSRVTVFADPLATAGNEISWESTGEHVTALAFSGDGQQLIIGTSFDQGGGVRVSSLDGRKQTVLETPVPVLDLLRAQGNAVFQLTGWAKGVIYLIDADSPDPQLIAVPGVPEVVGNE